MITATIFFMIIAQMARNRREQDTPISPGNLPWSVRILLFFAVMPLILTAGLRYQIGTDFGAYYKAEEVFGGHAWNSLRTLNEPGLPVLTEIISWFSHDGAVYIFTFSMLIVGLSAFSILKYSDGYIFAILLYIFCGLWHGAFNGVRQYLAATVLLLGHRFILDRKLWKYLLTVFTAFCFHSSAIVMIVPYFVMRNRISLRNVLLLAIGTLLVSLNYESLFSLIGFLKEKDIVMNNYATASVNILRVLANTAPAVLAIILYWNKEPDAEQTFDLNGLIINAAAMIASANSTYLARVSIYTSFFLPLGLSKLLRLEDKFLEQTLRGLTTLLFAVFWYVEVSGHPALNPFVWVFDR